MGGSKVDVGGSSVPRELSADERAKAARRRPKRPGRGKAIARWLVFVVAVVAIGGGLAYRLGQQGVGPMAVGEGARPGGDPGSAGTTTSTDYLLKARTYRPGDCVTWDQDTTRALRDTAVVPCDQPHLLEMTGAANVRGLITDYPGDAGWKAVVDQLCTPLAERHLGHQIDPLGRFHMNALTITPESWRAGDREIDCGIARSPDVRNEQQRFDRYVPFTGEVRGQPHVHTYEPGTCRNELSVQPVDFAGPHQFEIVGMVDVSDLPSLPAPDDDAGWQSQVGTRCQALAVRYLGSPWPDGVSYGWEQIQPPSWAAGTRVLPCWVGTHDGTAWTPTTGSLRVGTPA